MQNSKKQVNEISKRCLLNLHWIFRQQQSELMSNKATNMDSTSNLAPYKNDDNSDNVVKLQSYSEQLKSQITFVENQLSHHYIDRKCVHVVLGNKFAKF